MLIELQGGHHILRLRLQRLGIGLRRLGGGFKLGDGLFCKSQSLIEGGTDLLQRLIYGTERIVHLIQLSFDGIHFCDHLIGKVGV